MLKSTGVVRKVDVLRRIVIPMELRRTLGIEEKDTAWRYLCRGCIAEMKKVG